LKSTSSEQGFHFIQARFEDFDDLAEAVDGWDLDWQQLDRGRLDSKLQQVGTSNALLTRVRFSRKFHQRGSTPPGFVTVGLMGEQVQEIRYGTQIARNHELVIFPSGDEFDAVSWPGFSAHTFSFSEELLEARARDLGLPQPGRWIGRHEAVACDPRKLARLRARMREVLEKAALHPRGISEQELRAEVEGEIASLLLRTLDRSEHGGESISSKVRSRAVRRALDFVESRPLDVLTVGELRQATGVSRRTLQYAFQERFGITPKRYLLTSRLNGARRDLLCLAPGCRIADVANHWGFWHLGQFAADYRRQFGELPSETLARR